MVNEKFITQKEFRKEISRVRRQKKDRRERFIPKTLKSRKIIKEGTRPTLVLNVSESQVPTHSPFFNMSFEEQRNLFLR